MRFFAPSFINQLVHSCPIRDVHGPFYFFLLFHSVIALLKRLPCTLETGELLLFLPWSWHRSTWVKFKAKICENVRLIAHKLRSARIFCHRNSKITPRYFEHRGVATRRVPKDQNLPVPWKLVSHFTICVSLHPMPLKQHSFIKLFKININYTKTFDVCLKKFLSRRIFWATSGFLSTRESF